MNKPQQHFNLRQPAEWEEHEACWLAWPSHSDLWRDDLAAAQHEFVALCHAIVGRDIEVGAKPAERLRVLVPDRERLAVAKKMLSGLPVEFFEIAFGDIWMRDTAPIFVLNGEGKLTAARFAFNGWGMKYSLPFDDEVAQNIAEAAACEEVVSDFVLEGGSIEVDGEGTCITTRQCLGNKNRNPGLSQEKLEAAMAPILGIEKFLWLGDGLLNDHTDGHVDTLARFARPGVVLCMRAFTDDDPNRSVLEKIADDLATFTDAKGRRLEVKTIPSPGLVMDGDAKILPASYLNFYISNRSVVVPVYGSSQDGAAVDAIAEFFPGRETVGLSARAILSGGGAFHCITQQQPRERNKFA